MLIAWPALTLITDPSIPGQLLEEIIPLAIEGGVGMIQLRDKDAEPGELLSLACRLRRLIPPEIYFLINSHVDLAIACKADGVHLPEFGADARSVRCEIGQKAIIGRSVHSLESALAASKEPLDYLQLGTLFVTSCKPGHPGAGTALVREVCGACRLPVIGVGGINEGNAKEVLEAGAKGIAVISAILRSEAPKVAASRLKAAF